MYTANQLKELIEKASSIAGSQRKLAEMLEMEHANLVKVKQGSRPANWKLRGKLRVVLGEEPARAFMASMAEDLAESESADEKKAAEQLEAILAAFPEGDYWRKR